MSHAPGYTDRPGERDQGVDVSYPIRQPSTVSIFSTGIMGRIGILRRKNAVDNIRQDYNPVYSHFRILWYVRIAALPASIRSQGVAGCLPIPGLLGNITDQVGRMTGFSKQAIQNNQFVGQERTVPGSSHPGGGKQTFDPK